MCDGTPIFAVKEVSAVALVKESTHTSFLPRWGSYLSEHRRNDDGALSRSTWDASSIERTFLHCIGAFQYVLDLRWECLLVVLLVILVRWHECRLAVGCFGLSSSTSQAAVRFAGLHLLLSEGTHVTCGSKSGSFCDVGFVPRWMVFLCTG